MYGAMKSYQQRHLQFGAVGSAYRVPPRRFFKPYLIAIGIAFSGSVGLALVVGFAVFFLGKMVGLTSSVPSILASVMTGYAVVPADHPVHAGAHRQPGVVEHLVPRHRDPQHDERLGLHQAADASIPC